MKCFYSNKFKILANEMGMQTGSRGARGEAKKREFREQFEMKSFHIP